MTSDDSVIRQEHMDAAGLWYARLDSGTADIAAFEAWRDQNPAHAAAFARVAGVGFQLDRLNKLRPPDAEASDKKPDRRTVMAAGLGVAGVVTAAAFGTGLTVANSRARAATAIGENKTIRLPDGGTLVLNTDSAASWKFDGHGRRRVWLEKGEIALVVLKTERPCLLYGGDGTARIVEGDVNARVRGKSLDLTVVDGLCYVGSPAGSAKLPAEASGAEVRVAVGQAAIIRAGDAHVRNVDATDMQFISAWRNGELVFDGQTLGAAVAEYNRYLPKKIAILDAGLEDVRLGGRFKTHDPTDFLNSLSSSFGIHVTRDETGGILLSK